MKGWGDTRFPLYVDPCVEVGVLDAKGNGCRPKFLCIYKLKEADNEEETEPNWMGEHSAHARM